MGWDCRQTVIIKQIFITLAVTLCPVFNHFCVTCRLLSSPPCANLTASSSFVPLFLAPLVFGFSHGQVGVYDEGASCSCGFGVFQFCSYVMFACERVISAPPWRYSCCNASSCTSSQQCCRSNLTVFCLPVFPPAMSFSRFDAFERGTENGCLFGLRRGCRLLSRFH